MASPSHSEKTHEDFNHPQIKERDWLQLGLGLGFSINNACRKEEDEEEEEENHPNPFSDASPSSQLHHQAKQHPSLELGLSLGRRPAEGLELAPPSATSNYDQSLWLQNHQDDDDEEENHHCYYDDDDYMAPWWPSSCDMMKNYSGRRSFLGLENDDNDWQLPVPNNPQNDYFFTRSTRRPHSSGLWFTLQSYTNRNGEALPQIPKAYIRVKDENVTVFMVKKYLVRKLGLSNEAEVDISCMGQKLLQTQTLKQVRDCVWLPRLVEYVNSTSVSFQHYSHQRCVNDHLMSLQYGRCCASN